MEVYQATRPRPWLLPLLMCNINFTTNLHNYWVTGRCLIACAMHCIMNHEVWRGLFHQNMYITRFMDAYASVTISGWVTGRCLMARAIHCIMNHEVWRRTRDLASQSLPPPVLGFCLSRHEERLRVTIKLHKIAHLQRMEWFVILWYSSIILFPVLGATLKMMEPPMNDKKPMRRWSSSL